jgi:hypothetical protein
MAAQCIAQRLRGHYRKTTGQPGQFARQPVEIVGWRPLW